MQHRTASAVLALVCLALVASAAPVARADDCGGRSVVTVIAPGATWSVDLRWSDSARSWQRRYVIKGVPGDWRPMPHLGDHAHLVVFIPAKGPSFAVLNASAERDDADRLLVLTSLDGVLPARFQRYGLADLLTKDELPMVRRSISHVHWLRGGEADPPYGFDEDGTTLVLTVMSGRQVRVPLLP